MCCIAAALGRAGAGQAGGVAQHCLAAVQIRPPQTTTAWCAHPPRHAGHHKFKVTSVMLSRNVDYGVEINAADSVITAALEGQGQGASM